jgi:hypothetical protein
MDEVPLEALVDSKSPLALKIGVLLGMDRMTGHYCITLNFDWKHIIKGMPFSLSSL